MYFGLIWLVFLPNKETRKGRVIACHCEEFDTASTALRDIKQGKKAAKD